MRNKTRSAVLRILSTVIFLFMTVLVYPYGGDEDELPPPPSGGASEEIAPIEGEPIATLIFSNTKLDQIMMHLKRQTGVNVDLIGKVNDLRMDVIAQNEPVSQILQKIASSKNLVVVRGDSMNYKLMDEQTYRTTELPGMAQRKIFILKHIKAEDARKALQNVLTKGIGQMAADPRTNKLIVTDLPQVIELIKRLLDEIDVQLIWRAFYIRHADVASIADKLKNYKSGPGTIEVDPKTHQIIVYDIFQNIKRMEMLVEVLDVGPEMRVYNLNNIGVAGKIAQQLAKAIEQVITKDADVFWQIDDRSGTLIVQDVPEVHEKIEQILAALDQPVKQALIYAELVDTSFNRSYDFGIKWDVSEDLFSATRDGLFSNVPKGSGETSDNLGFLNLHEEFPTFSMDGSRLMVGYLNKYFRANLSAALSKSDTRILLQPRFIVKNQEEVKVKVGGSKPYRTTNYYTDNRWQSSGQASISYGLEVTMKPSISNNGLIEMEIEISNSDASFIGDVNENPLVEKTEVSAKTTLIIPSGETRVLAGLINNSDSDSREGIPFLVEIPIIGPALFGKKSEKDSRRNILFFVTPTIVEERPISKDFYRGKTIHDLMEDGEAPLFLDQWTSPSLTTQRLDDIDNAMNGPALSSDEPFELRRLLDKNAGIDLESLRQERLAVSAGPEGDFSSTSAPSAPPPPPVARSTVTQREARQREESPPEPDEKEKDEEREEHQYRTEERPYRPAPTKETEY